MKRDEAEEMHVSSLLMCMVTDRSAVLSLVSLKVVANVFSLKHLLIALEGLVFRGVWISEDMRISWQVRSEHGLSFCFQQNTMSSQAICGVEYSSRSDKDALHTLQRTN